MKSYRDLVRERRKKPDLGELENESIGHAAIIVSELFDAAIDAKKTERGGADSARMEDSRVRIVSGTLRRSFYDDLAAKLQEALDRGVAVDVIVLQNNVDLSDNPFAKAVESDQNKKNGGALYAANGSVRLPHFALVGNKSYRYETDPHLFKARAHFNEPAVGEMLRDAFETARRDAFETARTILAPPSDETPAVPPGYQG